MQTERHKEILDILEKQDSASVKELAGKLDVAESTIRSDLNHLSREGKLIRQHGGASAIKKSDGLSDYRMFESRLNINIEEKAYIAKNAIKLLENNESIMMDASTTCFELAKAINLSDLRLTVVTNGIKIAEIFKDNLNVNVVMIGGMVSENAYAIEGTLGLDILNNFNINKAFISCHCLDIESGLSDFNIYEVYLKREAIKQAAHVYVLADSSKFDKRSAATICSLEEIDALYTDKGLEKSIKERYEKAGLKIID